jgi:hypothetical protein
MKYGEAIGKNTFIVKNCTLQIHEVFDKKKEW